MALPTNPANSWMQGLDFPSRLFETGRNDCELYEEDGEFVLGVEMPGFEKDDITVSWDDGVLNIAAESEKETGTDARPTTVGSASRRTWTTEPSRPSTGTASSKCGFRSCEVQRLAEKRSK